jgi:hypothetical protein
LDLQGLTTGQGQFKFKASPALCQGLAGPDGIAGGVTHNHFPRHALRPIVFLCHAPNPPHQQHQNGHAQHHCQPNAKVQAF